jgi:hypothetical protein
MHISTSYTKKPNTTISKLIVWGQIPKEPACYSYDLGGAPPAIRKLRSTQFKLDSSTTRRFSPSAHIPDTHLKSSPKA